MDYRNNPNDDFDFLVKKEFSEGGLISYYSESNEVAALMGFRDTLYPDNESKVYFYKTEPSSGMRMGAIACAGKFSKYLNESEKRAFAAISGELVY